MFNCYIYQNLSTLFIFNFIIYFDFVQWEIQIEIKHFKIKLSI